MSDPPRFGRIDRFELLDLEGTGGMGAVYRARDPQRGDEVVALKLIRLDHADHEALELERKGAELQRRLSQEAEQVARVHEFGEAEDKFYVVMEYVEGRDLAKVLADEGGSIEPARATWIAYQLCRMLETAHGFRTEIDGTWSSGILHGDLKPENIRLQEGDRTRILDFGAAKFLAVQRKVTRNVHGTTLYVAPERWKTGMVNEQSDLWAVGIILYQMIAGYVPYPGSTNEEIQRQILSGPPRPLPADCPRKMKTILQRCLSSDPQRRYPTAGALREDLEAFRSGRPLQALSGEDVEEDAAEVAEDVGRTRRVRTREQPPPPPSAAPLAESEAAPPPAAPSPAPAFGAPTDAAPAIEPPREGPVPPSTGKSSGGGSGRRPPGPSSASPAGRWRRLVPAALVLIVLAILLSQVYVRSIGADIVQDVRGSATPDLEAAWERYRHAETFTLFGFGLGEAASRLRAAALTAADRVLSSYRQDRPTTRQGDWRRAVSYLEIAIELGDATPGTRAKLLCADAHVNRIDAASLRSQGKGELADRLWNGAIFHFKQAAKLAPEWPDPLLGLARIYAYDRFDLENLQEALDQARQRGYRFTDRERAQLADGHLSEGKQLYDRASEIDSRWRRRELLDQALFHLDAAADGYQEILEFGRAAENRREALRLIERIQEL